MRDDRHALRADSDGQQAVVSTDGGVDDATERQPYEHVGEPDTSRLDDVVDQVVRRRATLDGTVAPRGVLQTRHQDVEQSGEEQPGRRAGRLPAGRAERPIEDDRTDYLDRKQVDGTVDDRPRVEEQFRAAHARVELHRPRMRELAAATTDAGVRRFLAIITIG